MGSERLVRIKDLDNLILELIGKKNSKLVYALFYTAILSIIMQT